MSDQELINQVFEQGYPLEITSEQARALCACISRIMELVPPDDVMLVRGEYNAVTSALHHPEPELGY